MSHNKATHEFCRITITAFSGPGPIQTLRLTKEPRPKSVIVSKEANLELILINRAMNVRKMFNLTFCQEISERCSMLLFLLTVESPRSCRGSCANWKVASQNWQCLEQHFTIFQIIILFVTGLKRSELRSSESRRKNRLLFGARS